MNFRQIGFDISSVEKLSCNMCCFLSALFCVVVLQCVVVCRGCPTFRLCVRLFILAFYIWDWIALRVQAAVTRLTLYRRLYVIRLQTVALIVWLFRFAASSTATFRKSMSNILKSSGIHFVFGFDWFFEKNLVKRQSFPNAPLMQLLCGVIILQLMSQGARMQWAGPGRAQRNMQNFLGQSKSKNNFPLAIFTINFIVFRYKFGPIDRCVGTYNLFFWQCPALILFEI